MAGKKKAQKRRTTVTTYVVVATRHDGSTQSKDKTASNKPFSLEDARKLGRAAADSGNFKSVVIATSTGKALETVNIEAANNEADTATAPSETTLPESPATAPSAKAPSATAVPDGTVKASTVVPGTLVRSTGEVTSLIRIDGTIKVRGSKRVGYQHVNEQTGEETPSNGGLKPDYMVRVVGGDEIDSMKGLWAAMNLATAAKKANKKSGPSKRAINAQKLVNFLTENKPAKNSKVVIPLDELPDYVPNWGKNPGYRYWKVTAESDGEISMGGKAAILAGIDFTALKKDGLHLVVGTLPKIVEKKVAEKKTVVEKKKKTSAKKKKPAKKSAGKSKVKEAA